MKPITFTTEEKDQLQIFLKERIETYNKSFDEHQSSDAAGRMRFGNSYLRPALSALEKISNNQTALYSSKEKTALISCINEHYLGFYEQLQMPNILSWLNISDVQLSIINKIDLCKEVLSKCGYYDKKTIFAQGNPEFRYNRVLRVVDKLKKSEKIFLSRTAENEFYKIGFLFKEQEYLSFDFNEAISLKEIEFASLGRQSVEEVARTKFSIVTTKSNAKSLVKPSLSNGLTQINFDFFSFLLN